MRARTTDLCVVDNALSCAVDMLLFPVESVQDVMSPPGQWMSGFQVSHYCLRTGYFQSNQCERWYHAHWDQYCTLPFLSTVVCDGFPSFLGAERYLPKIVPLRVSTLTTVPLLEHTTQMNLNGLELLSSCS